MVTGVPLQFQRSSQSIYSVTNASIGTLLYVDILLHIFRFPILDNSTIQKSIDLIQEYEPYAKIAHISAVLQIYQISIIPPYKKQRTFSD